MGLKDKWQQERLKVLYLMGDHKISFRLTDTHLSQQNTLSYDCRIQSFYNTSICKDYTLTFLPKRIFCVCFFPRLFSKKTIPSEKEKCQSEIRLSGSFRSLPHSSPWLQVNTCGKAITSTKPIRCDFICIANETLAGSGGHGRHLSQQKKGKGNGPLWKVADRYCAWLGRRELDRVCFVYYVTGMVNSSLEFIGL